MSVTRPWSRRLATVVLVACGLIAAGCGDSDKGAAGAFQGSSDRDSETLAEVAQAMREFPFVNARLSRELQRENVPAAERSVARLDSILAEADTAAFKLEGDEARKVVDDYLRTMKTLVGGYDRLLVVATDPLASPGDLDGVMSDLQDTMLDVQAADRDLLRRLADSLPADQREAFQNRMADMQRELERLGSP